MSQCFYMPVKVIYGPHCVAENAALFAGFGKKALIVTSPSSASVKSVAAFWVPPVGLNTIS